MTDPNEGERREGRVCEQRFHLRRIPGLGSSRGLGFGKGVDDAAFLFVGEELGFGVWEVRDQEEGYDSADYRWDTFDYEDPPILDVN